MALSANVATASASFLMCFVRAKNFRLRAM
jgi:hypothetical protein